MKNKYYLDNRVKEYRINMGLTQKDLAWFTDLSQNTISDIENGKNNVSVFNALKLCIVFDCKVEDLFYFPDEDPYY